MPGDELNLLTPEEELERAELLEAIIETIQLLGDALHGAADLLSAKADAQDMEHFHDMLMDAGPNFNMVDLATHRVMDIDKDSIIRNN
jgi:hypothetical protein